MEGDSARPPRPPVSSAASAMKLRRMQQRQYQVMSHRRSILILSPGAGGSFQAVPFLVGICCRESASLIGSIRRRSVRVARQREKVARDTIISAELGSRRNIVVRGCGSLSFRLEISAESPSVRLNMCDGPGCLTCRSHGKLLFKYDTPFLPRAMVSNKVDIIDADVSFPCTKGSGRAGGRRCYSNEDDDDDMIRNGGATPRGIYIDGYSTKGAKGKVKKKKKSFPPAIGHLLG